MHSERGQGGGLEERAAVHRTVNGIKRIRKWTVKITSTTE